MFVSQQAGGDAAMKLVKKNVSQIIAMRLRSGPVDVRKIMMNDDDERVRDFIAGGSSKSHTAFSLRFPKTISCIPPGQVPVHQYAVQGSGAEDGYTRKGAWQIRVDGVGVMMSVLARRGELMM